MEREQFSAGAIIIDVETTASDPAEARIVQFAAYEFGTQTSFFAECDPGVPIPVEALKVNKFVFDPNKTYTPIKDVLSTISMLLNTKLPVIGWNLRPFILPTIVHESIRHNVPMPSLSDLETLDLTPIAAKCNNDPLLMHWRFWNGNSPVHQRKEPKKNTRVERDVELIWGLFTTMILENPDLDPALLDQSMLIDVDGKLVKQGGEVWFTFGKYDKGKAGKKSLRQVVLEDRGYVDWCLQAEKMPEDFKRHLRRLASQYAATRYGSPCRVDPGQDWEAEARRLAHETATPHGDDC